MLVFPLIGCFRLRLSGLVRVTIFRHQRAAHCFPYLLSLLFEQVRRVCDRRARAHCSCPYRCFSQHRVACSGLTRCSHMQLNAEWALRRKRHGHHHQLLVQDINGARFESLFIKAQKAFIVSGAFSSQLLQPSEILHIKHGINSISRFCIRLFPRMRGTGSEFGLHVSGASGVTSQNAQGMPTFNPLKVTYHCNVDSDDLALIIEERALGTSGGRLSVINDLAGRVSEYPFYNLLQKLASAKQASIFWRNACIPSGIRISSGLCSGVISREASVRMSVSIANPPSKSSSQKTIAPDISCACKAVCLRCFAIARSNSAWALAP